MLSRSHLPSHHSLLHLSFLHPFAVHAMPLSSDGATFGAITGATRTGATDADPARAAGTRAGNSGLWSFRLRRSPVSPRRPEGIDTSLQEKSTPQSAAQTAAQHPLQNAKKRPGTLRIHLYLTTTYTKLGLFVIGRSSVQIRSSAPDSKLLSRVLRESPGS